MTEEKTKQVSTAHTAPFEIQPGIIDRIRELRGEHRVALATIYHLASQTAIHASVRHDGSLLAVTISSPTPETQARREASILAEHLPDGCGVSFEIINPADAH